MVLVYVLFALVLNDLQAVESDRWIPVGRAGEAELYIDRMTISSEADRWIVWQKSVYPELGPQGEAIVQTEYDCARGTFSTTAYIFKDRSGSVLAHRTLSSRNRVTSAVSTDPRAEKVIEIVCGWG
jgi:hypothetical protein